jgi:hypothetical protein
MRLLLPVAFAIIALNGRDLAQEAGSATGQASSLVTHQIDDSSLSMPEGKTENPAAPELLPESSAIPTPPTPAPGTPAPTKVSERREVSLASTPRRAKRQQRGRSHRPSHAGHRLSSRARHTPSSHSELARRGRLHSGSRVNLQHRSVHRGRHTYRTRRHVIVYEYEDWGP